MTLAKLRPSLHQRMEKLEQRADGHDIMAAQVKEMYEVFDSTRRFFHVLNRLWVKLAAGALGLVGFLAAVLTIAEKVRAFWH